MFLALLLVITTVSTVNAQCGVDSINVLNYGAKGDGKTLDTAAIEKAFAAAIFYGLGCTVTFPSGYVFMTAPLRLQAGTTLLIDKNTTLFFPSTRDLHPLINDTVMGRRYQPLLYGLDAYDVAIIGQGTINGDGPGWWPAKPSGMNIPTVPVPPYTLECQRCDNFVVEAITVVDCPFVCVHPAQSNNVRIDGITVNNPIDSPNTDCVDPDSLTNSKVINSFFSCGDDHISVKAITQPTTNFLVENCTFYHGQGLTIGSQVLKGMTNVTFRNLTVHGALTGIRIKAQRAEGGIVTNLLYENIQLRSVGIMISVQMDFRHDGVVSPNPPQFNGVTLRNITGWGDLASNIICIPESPCKDWVLDNVFADNTSEVVMPYVCSDFSGTCTGCGAWPKLCDGLTKA